MTTTTQPFLAAEIAYRRDRAIAEYHQPAIRRPRHWVPRRPSLSLPPRVAGRCR